MKTPYDPKLREAAEEFAAICKKYDCMGSVLFVSPTHSEFVNCITPTWSVMFFDNEKNLRFKSKKEDFKSKEDKHEATEATVHGVTSFLQFSEKQRRQWHEVLTVLRKHMTVIYETWGDPDSVPGDWK